MDYKIIAYSSILAVRSYKVERMYLQNNNQENISAIGTKLKWHINKTRIRRMEGRIYTSVVIDDA